MPRFLGVDVGRKYIGLSVSDEAGVVALPADVVDVPPCGNDDACANTITKLISRQAQDRQIRRIVLGLPTHLSGEESPMTRLVKAVAERLEKMGYEVFFQDERLTSVEAEKYMIQMGKSPSRNKRQVNRISAVLILQTFLDSRRGEESLPYPEDFFEDDR